MNGILGLKISLDFISQEVEKKNNAVDSKIMVEYLTKMLFGWSFSVTMKLKKAISAMLSNIPMPQIL